MEWWREVRKDCSDGNHNILARGGRLVLINLVLDALTSYLMSIFPLPVKVEEKIDVLREIFCGMKIRRTKESIWLNGRR